MKIENKNKIETIIDSVIRDENDAREKELQAARDKVKGLQGTIGLQKKEIGTMKPYKYLLSRLEKLTCVYVCKECNGEGAFIYGEHGEGEMCGHCDGSGFMNHDMLLKREEKNAPQVQSSPNLESTQDDEILPF